MTYIQIPPLFVDRMSGVRPVEIETAMRISWEFGVPVLDDHHVLYGTFMYLYSQRVLIRGQYVPTVDEATPELIVRHGLHKVLRWLGESTETPALRKAREKHKIKVVRLDDGTYRVVPK